MSGRFEALASQAVAPDYAEIAEEDYAEVIKESRPQLNVTAIFDLLVYAILLSAIVHALLT